jgi:hypothetical protein
MFVHILLGRSQGSIAYELAYRLDIQGVIFQFQAKTINCFFAKTPKLVVAHAAFCSVETRGEVAKT